MFLFGSVEHISCLLKMLECVHPLKYDYNSCKLPRIDRDGDGCRVPGCVEERERAMAQPENSKSKGQQGDSNAIKKGDSGTERAGVGLHAASDIDGNKMGFPNTHGQETRKKKKKKKKKKRKRQSEEENTVGEGGGLSTSSNQDGTTSSGLLGGEDREGVEIQAGPSQQKKAKCTGGKGQPILPWMRVPIEIEAGGGVALSLVDGLHANLLAGLQKREPPRAVNEKVLHRFPGNHQDTDGGGGLL
jgi:hypothetical protein